MILHSCYLIYACCGVPLSSHRVPCFYGKFCPFFPVNFSSCLLRQRQSRGKYFEDLKSSSSQAIWWTLASLMLMRQLQSFRIWQFRNVAHVTEANAKQMPTIPKGKKATKGNSPRMYLAKACKSHWPISEFHSNRVYLCHKWSHLLITGQHLFPCWFHAILVTHL